METILIARSPLHISFGGSNTALQSQYEERGGSVLSMALNYYVYTILAPSRLDDVQIIYAGQHDVYGDSARRDPGRLDPLELLKAIIYHFKVRNGMNVFLASQAPPGLGLGHTASMAVSTIKAIAFSCGLDLEPEEVAELASYIEIDKLKMPVGKQDQYAAAFGGLTSITFGKRSASAEPLGLTEEVRQSLERHLLLFSNGIQNHQSDHLVVRSRDRTTDRSIEALQKLTLDIRSALEGGDLVAFGDLLHQCWLEKHQPGESSDFSLDRYYQLARENGAIGGDACQGSGFLVLYCPESRQKAVIEVLRGTGLRRWPFVLEEEGVQMMQAVPWSRPQVMSAGAWPQQAALQRSTFA